MFGNKKVIESDVKDQTLLPGIRNENGQVALAYYQPSPKMVTIGKKGIVFVAQHAVSMAWVDEEDVTPLLAMKKTCCGGSESPMFRYATQGQVNVWTTGDR
jgi:hypothetical protein